MPHRADFWESLRRATLPTLGRVLAEVNDALGTEYYATLSTDHDEYAGVVELSKEEVESLLHDMGACRNPAAAWKRLKNTQKYEQGSWAFRGSWGNKDWHHDPFGDYQLHVILFELDNDPATTALFAHYEYSWVTHPIKHYRGAAVAGDGSYMLRRLLSKNDVYVYANKPY